MKQILLLVILVMQIGCASPKKATTEADVSENIKQKIAATNTCGLNFFKTDYAKLALKTESTKKVKLKDYFKVIKNKPQTCNYDNNKVSVFLIRNSIAELTNLSNVQLKDYLLKTEKVLLDGPNTISEMALFLLQFRTLKSEVLKTNNEQLLATLKTVNANLNEQKFKIYSRALAEDVAFHQNNIYRTQTPEIEAMLKEQNVKDSEELALSYNKYKEVLNIEVLKNTITENMQCLYDKKCYLCLDQIQNKPCTDSSNVMTAKQAKQQLADGQYLIQILAPAYLDLLTVRLDQGLNKTSF